MNIVNQYRYTQVPKTIVKYSGQINTVVNSCLVANVSHRVVNGRIFDYQLCTAWQNTVVILSLPNGNLQLFTTANYIKRQYTLSFMAVSAIFLDSVKNDDRFLEKRNGLYNAITVKINAVIYCFRRSKSTSWVKPSAK